MRVHVLSDSDWQAKIDHATRCLTLGKHFEERSYGAGVLGITVVLNAHDPKYRHRQRVRFSKSKRILHLDVMLDWKAMIKAGHQARRDLVCESVCTDVAAILQRRQFPDFDHASFLREFERVIRRNLQGVAAARYDHLSLPQAAGT